MHSRTTFWLAAILFPPIGLFLLWKRPGRPIVKLAGTALLLALCVVHLVAVFGLRMEVDGSATRPIFYFGDHDDHYARLEEHRALQPSIPSPPPPPPAIRIPEAAPVSETVSAEPAPAPPVVPAAYWHDYRGPNRDGHYREGAILTEWPEDGLEELWRGPVGGGYASFVVADGKAFTIEQRRDREVIAAYDMATGAEVWTNGWAGDFQEAMGGPGPRATPVWHEGRIYALGAEGELRVIDAADGKTVWRKNILEENGAGNLNWAMSASPLIVEEKVIVLPGGSNGRSVVAYHKETGERIWSALDDQQAYTSPMLVTLAGQRQLLVVSAERVMGLTVEEGRLLWDHPWVTSYGANCAQPLIHSDDSFVISAGYGHGAALIKVVPGGDGFRAEMVWESNRLKNKFSTSVLHDGYVYGLDEAILACVDAATGELQWKGGRYGYGQVLLASGHLVITTERGDVVLVKATPQSHQEVARFSAVEGKTWNTPAIDGGRLLVRNTREMACYRIAP
jgi:outer membrane protein assembly factor BamB